MLMPCVGAVLLTKLTAALILAAMDNSTFREAVEDLGGQLKAAALLGITQGAVSQMSGGKRPVPLERCVEIERLTSGRFPCERLRPDVVWRRVVDTAWPWNSGKPLVDFSPAEAT
jgi:DNA-binding transcriptional regulator YdaS (Cro superfamily)